MARKKSTRRKHAIAPLKGAALEQALRDEATRMARGFRLIGAFLFQFSQLEFTIRARLAGALGLADDLFDAVVAPYDFAMLCTVTATVLTQKAPGKESEIRKTFKPCRALNDHRVRVAHALWTDDGKALIARHVSRQKLTAEYHYQNPEDLQKLREQAQDLMGKMFTVGAPPPKQARRSATPRRKGKKAPG